VLTSAFLRPGQIEAARLDTVDVAAQELRVPVSEGLRRNHRLVDDHPLGVVSAWAGLREERLPGRVLGAHGERG